MYKASDIIKKQEELIEHKRYAHQITNEIYNFISKPENFNKREYIISESVLMDDTKKILEYLGYKVEVIQVSSRFNTVIKW